ncbi:ABC transporter substrate-binding protein [Acidaminobacter sp. JC074]|uniref:ABC transporter substrate-binding protein n=1 Tax=Acidaminobacter sp. JC074 TaxID=2530199 RepID=UPI001F0FCD7F|nr:ABC transporter substrate-binding protein [Acidaminobacter sp. JC074]MCH4887469.1 ABC transporter substrate-binding protein [Acidaminobacter sp. JC074]
MKKFMSLLLVLVLVFSFVGCNSTATEPANTGSSNTGTETSTSTSTETNEPEEVYVVNLGITGYPTNTNPFTQTQQVDHNALRMYETLLTQDAHSLEYVGKLAESWTVSDDGTVWVIKLREGVTWTDGETFDADDVVFTYGAILDNMEDENATFARKADVKMIDKIEKTGDYEVTITTKSSVANFVDTPLSSLRILPEHIWGQMSVQEMLDFTNPTPVGTGPWKLIGEFNPQNTDLEYERNDNYWGQVPHVNGLLYILFENSDTMFQAFRAGTLDMFSPSGTQATALETEANVVVLKNMQPKLTELGINSWDDPASKGNPLLLNPNIRRAVDFALDKQVLVDNVLKGVGYAGSTLVPKSAGKWHLDIPHDYNPEKAIELLEAEGFTKFETVDISGREVQVRVNDKGEKLLFRFALLTNGYAWHYRDSMPFIVKWLEDVGVGLTIEPMDSATLGATMKLDSETFSDFDMYIWGWTPGYDPGFILTVLHTDQIGGRQEVMYSNPEYDALVDLQITQVKDEERMKTVYEAQQIIYNDAPYIPLYYQGYYDAYRDDKYEGFVQFAGDGTIFNDATYLNLKPIQ